MKQNPKAGKKKIDTKANIMEGYDDQGNLVMYYWQKEPIKTTWGDGAFKVRWQLRLNPIWRLKQWWWSRKPMQLYGPGARLK